VCIPFPGIIEPDKNKSPNRDGAQFCGACGQHFKNKNLCSNCGHINSERLRFCDKCGQSLIQADFSPIPSPSPPTPQPTTFVGGRYQVKMSLGEEGGRRRFVWSMIRLRAGTWTPFPGAFCPYRLEYSLQTSPDLTNKCVLNPLFLNISSDFTALGRGHYPFSILSTVAPSKKDFESGSL
jgi:hypothetical protein